MTLEGFRLSNVSFMKLERLLLKYFVPLSIDFVSVSRTNFFDSFSFETIDSCLFSSSTKVALDPFAEEGALFFGRFLTQKLSKLAWLRLKVPLLDCPRVKLLLLGCFRMLPLESLAVALLSTWPLSSDLRSYQGKNNSLTLLSTCSSSSSKIILFSASSRKDMLYLEGRTITMIQCSK